MWQGDTSNQNESYSKSPVIVTGDFPCLAQSGFDTNAPKSILCYMELEL